ncbi:MAG: glycosyltransferase family 4 protein [Alcaligenaceae bacterium]|nr:glycosyltransferase family 4 protein [Alcaligenaceae bacterium]
MSTDQSFKPLRILHSESAVGWAGQEQYIFRMVGAMRDRGHHMEVVCQPHAMMVERLRDAGFTVHTLPMRGTMNYLRGVGKIKKILRAGNFDVLNTHSRRDTLLAGMAGRLAGTPLIVRTRHLAKPPGSLLSYNKVPHRITTASNFVRQQLIDRGVPEGHVATVYPAVEFPPQTGQSTLRAELKLAPNDIVVGCVSALRHKKGHRELIQAMAPLIAGRPNLHLVVVGDGSPVFEELQAQAQEAGLTRRVHLLGRRDDVPNLMEGFDIFAMATRQEASGTVFVEAGAMGVPVIGTNIDGVPEMMQDGVNGMLVPLDDIPALTQAIRRLVEDPELRQRMGQAGVEFCRNSGHFSLKAMVERVESAYVRWLGELKK